MGKIFNKIFNILLVLIIIVLAIYLILRVSNKIKIYNVETGSMEDKIHTGDYILLYRTDDYQIGDVVTYRVNNYFITHRIIKIEDGKITTQGDANNTVDAEASADQIEGKVIYCGGILNIIINYKFVIAALLVCLYLLSSYFNSCNKKEDRKELNKEEDVIDDMTFEEEKTKERKKKKI